MTRSLRIFADSAVRRSPAPVLNGMILALVLSAILITASQARSQEIEPNDTLITGTLIDPIGSGGVTLDVATLGNGNYPDRDVDIYSFALDDLSMLPLILIAELASVDPQLDGYLHLQS